MYTLQPKHFNAVSGGSSSGYVNQNSAEDFARHALSVWRDTILGGETSINKTSSVHGHSYSVSTIGTEVFIDIDFEDGSSATGWLAVADLEEAPVDSSTDIHFLLETPDQFQDGSIPGIAPWGG